MCLEHYLNHQFQMQSICNVLMTIIVRRNLNIILILVPKSSLLAVELQLVAHSLMVTASWLSLPGFVPALILLSVDMLLIANVVMVARIHQVDA